MWAFKSKPVAQIPLAPDWSPQISRLRAWRPLGQSFQYLGRLMVVTRHHDYWPASGGFGYGDDYRPGFIYPCLSADYADDHGVIHSVKFTWLEAEAIMEAMP